MRRARRAPLRGGGCGRSGGGRGRARRAGAGRRAPRRLPPAPLRHLFDLLSREKKWEGKLLPVVGM